MTTYWDWKLDDQAKSIVWIKEIDGETKVIVDVDGWWKKGKDVIEAVDRVEPNVLFNSRHEVTSTCTGKAALQEWEMLGRPTKEPLPASLEYIANISPCPESITKHWNGCCYDACILDKSLTDEVRAAFGVVEAD